MSVCGTRDHGTVHEMGQDCGPGARGDCEWAAESPEYEWTWGGGEEGRGPDRDATGLGWVRWGQESPVSGRHPHPLPAEVPRETRQPAW